MSANPGRRPMVAGNWKMNGQRASAAQIHDLLDRFEAAERIVPEVMICPPATLLMSFRDLLAGSGVRLGGQDCHPEPAGAHTGDISAEMLADAGCDAVIVGHSERRGDHGETSALVAEKAAAAHRAGLTAIICIGETEAERDAGRTLDVLGDQLDGSVPETATPETTTIAYEPVWAIGTGRTPSGDEVAEAHGFIRDRLKRRLGDQATGMRLLYGGSVKPGNARDLMAIANVDGALVGGASLKAEDFWGIITSYNSAS